jgi:phosphoglycerate dehydrogenase-like enzyme
VEYVGDMEPYDYERAALAEAGAELRVVRCADEAELVAAAADADVVWLEWTPHLTGDGMRRLPRLGLVMRWGVGYDQIDVPAATELGIAVANAPTYCTEDVAEHAMALMLSLSRQVAWRHEQMRAGQWRIPAALPRRLQGSTVGIVGLGRIGRRVAELAGAFGARILGYDLMPVTVPGVEVVDLDRLLAESDFVSLHVPMAAQSQHLINADTLGMIKSGAFLVNTSRGGVVDTAALVQALESGRVSAAALDVFETEPLPADDPLRSVPNVVLTPHGAAGSDRSLTDLRREMCDATVQWLTTGWAGSVVNPEIRGRQRRVQSA